MLTPKPQVRWVKYHADAKIPRIATAGSAGADLVSVDHCAILPNQTRMVQTGLKVAIPKGYCMLLLPRSGLAKENSVTLGNSPGLIDSDYRGPLNVLLRNEHPTDLFAVAPGDRICQMLIIEEFTSHFDFVEVDDLDETERGEGGFGSTGVSA